MAIQLVAGSFTRAQVNLGSSTNMTVNVGTGSDRLLVVFVLSRTSEMNISSITYNGVALTHASGAAASNNPLWSKCYYLVNPAAGSNTLSLSYTGNQQSEIKAVAFVGVDQTSPLDQVAPGTGTGASPSVSITPTEDGELIVGGIIHETSAALSTGGGETTLDNQDNGAWVSSSSYVVQGTAGAHTFDWSAGTSDVYAMSVASFRVAADANTSPSVALNSPADEATVTDGTPELAFTGTDADGDDIRYNVQIGDDAALAANGPTLADNHMLGGSANFHPQPSTTLTWQGEFQVDDRPGQSFTGQGGILDKIVISIGPNEDSPDGTAVVRVYAHQGTYGTSSEPLNAAEPADTPTPGWLAESDPVTFDAVTNTVDDDYEFPFSGDDRIRLEDGAHYVLIFDWRPSTPDSSNTLVVHGDGTVVTHAGNSYFDGFSGVNNGIQLGWDLQFEVYESFVLLDKVSGTDAGFSGSPDNSDPFASGQQVTYTVQAGDALADAAYYWRVRGVDPAGTNIYGEWSEIRAFTVDAGGDVGAIGGGASGGSTAGGSLSGAGFLSGSVSAAAGANASAAARGALSGGITAQAATAGVLAAGGVLEGGAAGSATAIAELEGAGALGGAVDAPAAAGGVLTASAALSGAVAGQASVSGALNAPPDELAGTSSGAAQVDGSLSATGALAGAPAGSAIVSGDLAAVGALAAQVSAAATASGQMSALADGALFGGASGQATVTASIVGSGVLQGSGMGATTTTGHLGGIVEAVGAVACAGVMVGVLTATGAISAAAVAAGLVEAALTATGYLVGVAAGNATATLRNTQIVFGDVALGDAPLYLVEVGDAHLYRVALDDEPVYLVALVDRNQP